MQCKSKFVLPDQIVYAAFISFFDNFTVHFFIARYIVIGLSYKHILPHTMGILSLFEIISISILSLACKWKTSKKFFETCRRKCVDKRRPLHGVRFSVMSKSMTLSHKNKPTQTGKERRKMKRKEKTTQSNDLEFKQTH